MGDYRQSRNRSKHFVLLAMAVNRAAAVRAVVIFVPCSAQTHERAAPGAPEPYKIVAR